MKDSKLLLVLGTIGREEFEGGPQQASILLAGAGLYLRSGLRPSSVPRTWHIQVWMRPVSVICSLKTLSSAEELLARCDLS